MNKGTRMNTTATSPSDAKPSPRRKGGFFRILRRILGYGFLLIVLLLAGLFLYALATQKQDPIETGEPHMKAVIYTEYGSPDVLEVREIKKPVPNDDQVLVKVRAAAINPLDWHFMEGTPYIMRAMIGGTPQTEITTIGVDLAGEVEAVGKNVTQFKPGDEVFGTGHGAAFAEYVCANKTKLVVKPANVTFAEGAAVPIAALTALQGLRDYGKVQPGQKVLINGASGGVGTFAVQIAKILALKSPVSAARRTLELVQSLGADHVIDYTKEDFTKGSERYDVILDNVGTQPLSGFRRVLKPNGILVMIGGGGPSDGEMGRRHGAAGQNEADITIR